MRRVQCRLLLLISLLLTACVQGTGEPAQGAPSGELTGTLTVLDWAGYDDPNFWIDFQTMYPKVTVNFEIGASDADIYTKINAGSHADIFHPYTGWLQFYVDEGLVEAIDTSQLTNWDKVPDSFKQIGQFNGKQYFIPLGLGLHLHSLPHRQSIGKH